MATHDAFISHHSKDKPVVLRLCEALVAAGIEPWLDKWEIGPGDVVVARLEGAVLCAPKLLLCVGPHGVSRWVQEEYRAFLTLAQQDRARVLIPVRLPGAREDGADLPLFARGRLWADLSDESQWDAGVAQLVAAIRGERPRRPAGRKRTVDKLTSRQFSSRLDRRTAWGEFVVACNEHHHLVAWGTGDSRQSLVLFYERIKDRLRDHAIISFGNAVGAGATAREWADWLAESVLRRRGGSMADALRAASQDDHVVFLLDNQRGVLDEEALGQEYIDELVRFVEDDFAPAIAEVRPSHAVRLFLAIQTDKRRSALARCLRDAMGRVFEAAPVVIDHRELARIKLPTAKEVLQSFDELLRPLPRLSRAERAEVKAVVAEASRTGNLQQLAERLYPLYERFYSVRVGDQDHGR